MDKPRWKTLAEYEAWYIETKLRLPRLARQLLHFLGSTNRKVSEAAGRAFTQLPADELAKLSPEVIEMAMSAESPGLHWHVLEKLSVDAVAKSADRLVAGLQNPEPSCRDMARRTLGRLPATSLATVVEKLVPLLEPDAPGVLDACALVRKVAPAAITAHVADVVRSLVRLLPASTDSLVRRSALEVMCKIPPRLLERHIGGERPDLLMELRSVRAHAPSHRLTVWLPLLRGVLSSVCAISRYQARHLLWCVWQAVLVILGQRRVGDIEGRIRRMIDTLGDSTWHFRRAANRHWLCLLIGKLSAVGHPETVRSLFGALGDQDAGVRTAAVQSLLAQPAQSLQELTFSAADHFSKSSEEDEARVKALCGMRELVPLLAKVEANWIKVSADELDKDIWSSLQEEYEVAFQFALGHSPSFEKLEEWLHNMLGANVPFRYDDAVLESLTAEVGCRQSALSELQEEEPGQEASFAEAIERSLKLRQCLQEALQGFCSSHAAMMWFMEKDHPTVRKVEAQELHLTDLTALLDQCRAEVREPSRASGTWFMAELLESVASARESLLQTSKEATTPVDALESIEVFRSDETPVQLLYQGGLQLHHYQHTALKCLRELAQVEVDLRRTRDVCDSLARLEELRLRLRDLRYEVENRLLAQERLRSELEGEVATGTVESTLADTEEAVGNFAGCQREFLSSAFETATIAESTCPELLPALSKLFQFGSHSVWCKQSSIRGFLGYRRWSKESAMEGESVKHLLPLDDFSLLKQQLEALRKYEALQHPHLASLGAAFYSLREGQATLCWETKGHPFTIETWPCESTESMLRALRDMASVVSYIHQKGFVHGNLKPIKFMVTSDGEVQLLDVGASLMSLGEFMIADAFRAPEVARWYPVPAEEGDIYSLGKIFMVLVERCVGALALFKAARARPLEDLASEMTGTVPRARPPLVKILKDSRLLHPWGLPADDLLALRPPAYWTDTSSSGGAEVILVPCSDDELQRLRDLVASGQDFGGRDLRDRGPCSRLVLDKAWRVENRALWLKYASALNAVRETIELTKDSLGSDVGVHVKEPLAAFARLRPENVDRTVGEVYLLHGTTFESMRSIGRNGLNPQFATEGLFGEGIYLAEDIDKANQYTVGEILPESWGRSGRGQHLVLVCRAIIGRYLMTQDGITCVHGQPLFAESTSSRISPLRPLRRKRELRQIPKPDRWPAERLWPVLHYDSLVAEPSHIISRGRVRGVQRFREFVFFHGDRLYPEYILSYHWE